MVRCVQMDKAYLNFITNRFCQTMEKIVLMCSQVLPTISTKHHLPSRINQELPHLAEDLPLPVLLAATMMADRNSADFCECRDKSELQPVFMVEWGGHEGCSFPIAAASCCLSVCLSVLCPGSLPLPAHIQS